MKKRIFMFCLIIGVLVYPTLNKTENLKEIAEDQLPGITSIKKPDVVF